jgi:thiol-disulfide isomerase/thioredoxin
MRRVLASIALVVGLAAPVVAADDGAEAQPFPNLSMTTLDGTADINLDSFRGRPVLLTFWASWCGPCRVELPELRDLYGELVGEGFVLLTINVDNSPLIAERYLAKLGLKIPVYRMSRRDISALDINALPTNILLDRGGTVVMATLGYDPAMPAEIRRLVSQMDEPEPAGGGPSS